MCITIPLTKVWCVHNRKTLSQFYQKLDYCFSLYIKHNLKWRYNVLVDSQDFLYHHINIFYMLIPNIFSLDLQAVDLNHACHTPPQSIQLGMTKQANNEMFKEKKKQPISAKCQVHNVYVNIPKTENHFMVGFPAKNLKNIYFFLKMEIVFGIM